MLIIEKLTGYTIPLFGNRRSLPYGKLLVSDGYARKQCEIRETKNGDQYIVFRRQRYGVKNAGTLYQPNYCLYEKGWTNNDN